MAKVKLAPGESGTVRFELTCEDIAFPGETGERILEAGTIEVMAGPGAERQSLLKKTLQIKIVE